MPTDRIQDFFLATPPAVLQPRLRTDLTFLGSTFVGPQTIDDLVQHALEEGRRQGRQSAERTLKAQLEKSVGEYVTDVLGLGTRIKGAVGQFAPGVSIKEFRAQFNLVSKPLNLFFLIDAEPGNEYSFAAIATQIEQVWLQKHNKIVDIVFVNVRNKSIDSDAIDNDYPFRFDLRVVENATRTSTRQARPA